MLKSNIGRNIVKNKNVDISQTSHPVQSDEDKAIAKSERQKSTKAAIVCTSLAVTLAIVFAIIVVLYAINLNKSSGTDEAVGNLLSFVILLVYAGSAVAALCLGLCIAAIATSSVAIKSTNPKNQKIATITLILSIILMLATIACVIYVLLNVLA